MLNYKIFLFTVFLFSLCESTHGQWVNHLGGWGGTDWSNSVAVNDSGNVYITGLYDGSDMFVAKIKPNGDTAWFEHIISTDSGNEGFGIVTDNSGRCYVTGVFRDTATFGSILLTTGSSDEIFLVCYDSNGNALWAKKAGGGYEDVGQGITMDNYGNLYITGYYDGNTYGPASFGPSLITGKGTFIAKYDSSGVFNWVTTTAASSSKSIALDNQGNIFTTGHFEGTIAFGSTTLVSMGFSDIFIAKFDSNGNVIWVNQAGGSASIFKEQGYGISTDSYGNCYVTGTYSGITNFSSTSISGFGSTGIFLAKYAPNGSLQWVRNAGGSSQDFAFDIVTDFFGNSYITGTVGGNANFGSTTIPKGVFVTRYDINGNVIKVENAVSDGFSGVWGNGICLDNQNNCYVSGFFDGTADFGSIVTSFGVQDIFTWKLGQVVGIDEITKKNDAISFFPNPFSVQATITTSDYFKDATLTLFNSYGKKVKQINSISGQTIILQREKLPVGIYYVQLIQANKLITIEKLIIAD